MSERRFPYPDEIKPPEDIDLETYKRMYPYFRLPATVLFGRDAPKELVEWERKMFAGRHRLGDLQEDVSLL